VIDGHSVHLAIRISKGIERFSLLRRLEDNVTALRQLHSEGIDAAKVGADIVIRSTIRG